MAAVLVRTDSRPMASVHPKQQFPHTRRALDYTVLATPIGVAVGDYLCFRDIRLWADIIDSVRDALAFLEVCLAIGSRATIQ